MKILLLVVGKTDQKYLSEGIDEYVNRLKHYIGFDYQELPDVKNRKTLTPAQQKKREAELIEKKLKVGDKLLLLDEGGTEFTSITFSKFLQKQMNSGIKRVVFVVGGPYGFDESIYAKSKAKISISRMTFSHQMVRLFFVEQLYRGMTILKNEPYHHQ